MTFAEKNAMRALHRGKRGSHERRVYREGRRWRRAMPHGAFGNVRNPVLWNNLVAGTSGQYVEEPPVEGT